MYEKSRNVFLIKSPFGLGDLDHTIQGLHLVDRDNIHPTANEDHLRGVQHLCGAFGVSKTMYE